MLKVLLVDDEPLVLIGIQGMIDWGSLGWEVAGTARNGSEALRLISETQPDLVLCDIRMPVMARLVTDIAAGDSALFAVADVDGFLAGYADKVDGDAAALWEDCPMLTGLDAGVFSTAEDIYTDVDGQALLAGLTVLPARSAGPEALALLG